MKLVPTIRPSSESAIKYAIETVFRVKQNDYPYQNCLNCRHWNFDMDGCNKFQAKPPTEIIVYSCGEHYEEIDIPF